MRRPLITLAVAVPLWLGGCTGDDHAHESSQAEEAPTRAVTLWTQQMELFMEYPLLVAGTPGKFIVHLTTLHDFQPVRSGRVRLEFRDASGQQHVVEKDTLLREGIFTPLVELAQPGAYGFVLTYVGLQESDSFTIEGFEVYASADAYPPEEESDAGGISYLKEQQWKTEFQTEPITERVVRKSVHMVAEVMPRSHDYAVVSAPVAGLVRSGGLNAMPPPGTRVRAGQRLVALAPTLGGENSWNEARLGFERSRLEWERAERLLQKDAISRREHERIRQEYLVRNAGMDAFGSTTDSSFLEVVSPMAGIVSEVHVHPGQTVAAGQPLVTVVDPGRVWLKVSVFEKDYYTLGTPGAVHLTIPGLDSGLAFEGPQMQFISTSAMVDPRTRTIPLLVEVPNREGLLKIGQTLSGELLNGESRTHLAVPQSALFDDEAMQVVFVHVSGESFEKRVVQTGSQDRDWVAIVAGLMPGDRVVTKGGYQVKLASTTAAIGHPHAH